MSVCVCVCARAWHSMPWFGQMNGHFQYLKAGSFHFFQGLVGLPHGSCLGPWAYPLIMKHGWLGQSLPERALDNLWPLLKTHSLTVHHPQKSRSFEDDRPVVQLGDRYQEVSTIITQIFSGWWFGTFFFPFSWEYHHPNWRTHIFQRGRSATNQFCMYAIFTYMYPSNGPVWWGKTIHPPGPEGKSQEVESPSLSPTAPGKMIFVAQKGRNMYL